MVSSALSRLVNLQRHFQVPKGSDDNLCIGMVKLTPDVSEALSRGRAVVALESTIISHGMPYPQNLETAKEVEAIVRENGAVPATVAILDGVPCVGLSAEELERLANLGTKARKTARRDIAHVVATKGDGATTVSATMIFASMVGIPVFVTGGIGGVHRHGENILLRLLFPSINSNGGADNTGNGGAKVKCLNNLTAASVASATSLGHLAAWSLVGPLAGRTWFAPLVDLLPLGFSLCSFNHTCSSNRAMDVSSDLTELGRTPVAVISAGVKSILDIPRTLEHLETQGVCVAAYKTNEFPAFFTETSGCKAPCRVDTPEDCARLIDANMKLKLGTGILIANPIPKEHAASGSLIDSAIQRALREARDKGITGNAETPFLLGRVNELTGGASLSSNIALVKNNALLGAKISVSLAQMRERDDRVCIGRRMLTTVRC
ncbi:unnamed protein product [Camellia sinensis]